MLKPFFFGYGSLVNLATHDYANTAPATIKGWRRAWRHSPVRQLSFLTAVPSALDQIEGVIAEVPDHDWAGLDIREYAYTRIEATNAVSHPIQGPVSVSIYAIPTGSHRPPDSENPVLLSYLDVVIEGYFETFGEDGVARFFSTTDGWTSSILNDRDDPIYKRHQPTTRHVRNLVDHHLSALTAKLKQA